MKSAYFVSFVELLFVCVLLIQRIFSLQIIKIRNKMCILYYIHEKLHLNNSGAIVTLIRNILFGVIVFMNIPLIRQNYHRNKFCNGDKFIAFLSNLKASGSMSVPVYF